MYHSHSSPSGSCPSSISTLANHPQSATPTATVPGLLVTGASDAIGFGIARKHATNSFNVISHGRNPEKLEEKQIQLQGKFKPIQFRTAVLNASSATSQHIHELVASLDGLNLTVPVNNVGDGAKVQPLERTTAEELDFMINVNVRFAAQLTRALMRKLARPDGPTLIMNIGSFADSDIP